MIHGKEIITLKEDKDYLNWLIELKQRFLSQRLKASSAVNANLLEFYLSVGKDIEVRQYANTYGSGFFDNLSKDMKRILPGVQGLSPINLRYMNRFYRLYSPIIGNLPQSAEDFNPTPKANVPQPAEDLALREIMSIPWDHHRRIIDKCGNDVQKALFFVKKTHENNWSRNVLVNWLSRLPKIPTFLISCLCVKTMMSATLKMPWCPMSPNSSLNSAKASLIWADNCE